MPVNVSLMNALRKKLGAEEGTKRYYQMENAKGKTGKAFKKGVKTAQKEGRAVKNLKAYKAKKKK